MIGAPPLSPGHHIATTADELQLMVNCLRGARDRAVDAETDGLRYKDGQKPIGWGVGYLGSDGHPYCWYVPVAHRTAEPQANPDAARRAIRDALEGTESLIGHHLKFDLNMARADGWEIPEGARIHDTYIQAGLTYERRALSLEAVAANEKISLWDPYAAKNTIERYTRARAKAHGLTWKQSRPSKGKRSYLSLFGHSEVPVALEGEYNCRDLAHSLLLDRCQRDRAMGLGTPCEVQRRHLYDNEMLLVRALADMEWNGQIVDADYLRQLSIELMEDLGRRSIELNRLFNIGWSVADWRNDNNVRDLIYNHLKLPVVKMTQPRFGEPKPSIDRSAMLMLRDHHPGLEALGEFKVREKVENTYTNSLAFYVCADGKVHPSFRQAGTFTGRLSGAEPNFQNIPIRHLLMATAIRKAFLIEEGMARIFADYSQVELRHLGWITGGANLTASYRSESWEHMMAMCGGKPTREWYEWYREARKSEPAIDAHGDQAKAVFGVTESSPDWKLKRRGAKILNFGVSYGMGPPGLQGNPELMLSEAEAKDFFQRFHHANPEIDRAKKHLFTKMLNARGVPKFTNWAGRTVHGPRLRNPDPAIKSAEERSIFAALVQGSAAELTRYSVVKLWQAWKRGELPAVGTSQVHDEVQLDCRVEDVPEVARTVQRIMEDFHGLFGNIPIVCDIEVSTTTWADKEEYIA